METSAPHRDAQAARQFERLVFFSDAVIAIAITLLVLDLKAVVGGDGKPHLTAALPKIVSFLIGFYVIARYWLAHHALFGALRREDGPLRIVNLVFLASIVFLPFPTSVLTEYSTTTASVVFFAGSSALVGVLFILLVLVARRPALMDGDAGRNATRGIVLRSASSPIVFGASIPIAFQSHAIAMESWILIAPVHWLMIGLVRKIDRGASAASPASIDPLQTQSA